MMRPQDSREGISAIILEAIGRILEVDVGKKKTQKNAQNNKKEGAQDVYPEPYLLFWNILWIFLGENKTPPQRKMDSFCLRVQIGSSGERFLSSW